VREKNKKKEKGAANFKSGGPSKQISPSWGGLVQRSAAKREIRTTMEGKENEREMERKGCKTQIS